MYNNQKLKKLAKIAAEESKIPQDIEKFVLTKLNKQELKAFLNYYKSFLSKKRVFITSSQEISKETLSHISQMYKDNDIITLIDPSVGAGIKLQHDDLVVDFTFLKYINDTIDKLKN